MDKPRRASRVLELLEKRRDKKAQGCLPNVEITREKKMDTPTRASWGANKLYLCPGLELIEALKAAVPIQGFGY
jgi:hypothetical protein